MPGGTSGWTSISKSVRDVDEEQVRDCKEDIDTLLVFAGLFSAVMTAFIVESYQTLQPDNSDTIVRLLERISSQTQGYQLSNGFLTSTAPPLPPLPPFQPSHAAIIVNALWFSSLIVSLVTASFGMLVKQWLREYLAGEYVSAQARLRVRHFRRPGLEAWKVFDIASLLPVLLQSALALFFIGLCVFTWSVDPTIGHTTVPLVGGWAFLFAMSAIAPLLSPRCPYKATFLKRLTKTIRRRLSLTVRQWHIWLLRTLRTSVGNRRYFRRLFPMLSYQMTSFVLPSQPWPVEQPYEEDIAAKDDSFDRDILLAVDKILQDDELLASTMWDLLAKTRISANERLTFVFSILGNRLQETIKSNTIVPHLSNLPRRQCYILSDLLVDLLDGCLKQLCGTTRGPRTFDSWTGPMADTLIEICSPAFYEVATQSSWDTVKTWFCDAKLRRSIGVVLTMGHFVDQRRRYLLNLRHTLASLKIGEDDSFAVITDSIQWFMNVDVRNPAPLPSPMLLSSLRVLPETQLDLIIPRGWQEPFVALMDSLVWFFTIVSMNTPTSLNDVVLEQRIRHTCEHLFVHQQSRVTFLTAFATCRSVHIIGQGGILDRTLSHIRRSRRLAGNGLWNGPFQIDIENMYQRLSRTKSPDMEWALRFTYLLLTFIPPELRKKRLLSKWRPAFSLLYPIIATCPRNRTDAESFLACNCLYAMDRIDGPSGTRPSSVNFKAWCLRIHRSNGTLFAANGALIKLLFDIGRPEEPWPWCVQLHWYLTNPLATRYPLPDNIFATHTTNNSPAPPGVAPQIPGRVTHRDPARVFSLSTPTASEPSVVAQAPSFPIPNIPWPAAPDVTIPIIHNADVSHISNTRDEPKTTPLSVPENPTPNNTLEEGSSTLELAGSRNRWLPETVRFSAIRPSQHQLRPTPPVPPLNISPTTPAYIQEMADSLIGHVAHQSDTLSNVLIQQYSDRLAGLVNTIRDVELYQRQLCAQWSNDCRLPWQNHQTALYRAILDHYQTFLDDRRKTAYSAARNSLPRDALRWITVAQDVLDEEQDHIATYAQCGIPSSAESRTQLSQDAAPLSSQLDILVFPTQRSHSPISPGLGSRPRTPTSPRTPLSLGSAESVRLESILSKNLMEEMAGPHGELALRMAHLLALNRMEVAMRRSGSTVQTPNLDVLQVLSPHDQPIDLGSMTDVPMDSEEAASEASFTLPTVRIDAPDT